MKIWSQVLQETFTPLQIHQLLEVEHGMKEIKVGKKTPSRHQSLYSIAYFTQSPIPKVSIWTMLEIISIKLFLR